MLLETVQFDISLEIFEVHFLDFIQKWGNLVLEQHKVGDVRIRYDVYYQEGETKENKVLLAEVEATKVNKDQIEVRIALIELDKGYAHDFVPALGHFFDSKWHDHLILDDYDDWDLKKGLGHLKQALMEKRGFDNLDDLSSPINLPEGIEDKYTSLVANMHEELRLSTLRELQERLPPIKQDLAENVVLGKPKEPRKPEKTEGLNKWFEYYHDMKAVGLKYTLKQLSKDVRYSESTIRKRHMIWKEQQGDTQEE